MAHPLDNPVWYSLITAQSAIALGTAQARRYPSEIAPFVAVDERDPDESAALSLVDPDEPVYFVAVAPPFSSSWTVTYQKSIVQMVCDKAVAFPKPVSEVTTLSAANLDDILALTGLVYPEFFRPGTLALGTYLGIYQQGRLAAMAGERMRIDGYGEISAVCTHPDFSGRGYAAQLLTQLVNATFERGSIPFLHVGQHNERALSLYERLGFRRRIDLGLWSVRRRS